MQKKFGCIVCVAVLFVGLVVGHTATVTTTAAGSNEDDNTNNVVNATQTDAQLLSSCNGTQTATSNTGTNSPCTGGGTLSAQQALRGKLNNTCVNAFCGVDDTGRPVDDSSEEIDDDVINATVSKGDRSQQHQHRSHLLPSPAILVVADEEDAGAALEYGGKKVVLKAEVLKHTSVLYGLISIAERDELSERCYRELQRVYHGIQQKEIWAMKGSHSKVL
uniref:Uncharacterized protein n=1 Tax=Anopheles maculatus TaxID=74869 RepID=A0A182SPX9_9DIPT